MNPEVEQTATTRRSVDPSGLTLGELAEQLAAGCGERAEHVRWVLTQHLGDRVDRLHPVRALEPATERELRRAWRSYRKGTWAP